MEKSITTIWGPISSILREKFTAHRTKQILGYLGFNMNVLSGLPLTTNTADKDLFMNRVEVEYFQMDQQSKESFLIGIIEEILREKPDLKSEIEERTIRLGWKFHGDTPISIDMFDVSELVDMPIESHKDLIKAVKKMRDGDPSGAISSLCGAIDSITTDIYKREKLGNVGDASFQEKIATCLKAVGFFKKLQEELITLKWPENEAKKLVENYKGSINQAAYMLGSLRCNMGDVHGTKPCLDALVFDSIKWASLILRLFH
jgi:hypothetical protein